MSHTSQEYIVKKTAAPMRIDGKWDKPAWQAIEPLTVALHMGAVPDHRPDVLAKLAWDDNGLYIIFHVEDRYVRAVAQKYQDPVCRDSCVEFFFTPGTGLGLSYFNVEINCGGTLLFWWHPEGGPGVPVNEKEGGLVEIAHSMPRIVEPEITTPTAWTLEYRLPFAALEKYCPSAERPAPGAIWQANFYKCADDTSHPHWLTWSFVDHPAPKFHLPQYFGVLRFE